MASTSSSSFNELLFPGIKKIFGDTYNMWSPEYTALFDTVPSDKSFEFYQSLTGFGLVPVKQEGSSVSYDDPIQGFKTTVQNVTFGLGFKVTSELIEDDQYSKVRQFPKALAFSVMQTVETRGANLYNNGFDPLFPFVDGEPLFSVNHKLESGGVYSNRAAVGSDLSSASFEQMLIDIQALVNGRGLKIKVMPQQLIVTPTDDYTASKELESTQTPENDFNSINPSRGRLPKGFVVNHYITDPDLWAVRTNVDGIILQSRRFPASMSMDNSFDSDEAKFKTTFRLEFSAYDFRSVYGNPGS